MNNDLIDYRSRVFSILKIDFGWNGIYPEFYNEANESQLIRYAFANSLCLNFLAQNIAEELERHCATWRERIDGKPNTRLSNKPLVN